MKKLIAIIMIAVIALSMCGCSAGSGRIGTERFAKNIAAGEKIKVVDVDKSKKLVLTCESKERDLIFYVKYEGILQGNIFNQSLSDLFTPCYSSDYYEQVRELYMDDALEIIETLPGYYLAQTTSYRIQYDVRFDDGDSIDEMAEKILELDEIFSEELEYHDEEWLQEHYFMTIAIKYMGDTYESTGYKFVKLDGTNTLKSIKKVLNSTYE